jgi:hypothetical protein
MLVGTVESVAAILLAAALRWAVARRITSAVSALLPLEAVNALLSLQASTQAQ